MPRTFKISHKRFLLKHSLENSISSSGAADGASRGNFLAAIAINLLGAFGWSKHVSYMVFSEGF